MKDVCEVIRRGFNEYNNEIEINIRNVNLRADGGSFIANAPSAKKLPDEFKKLEDEYKEVLMIEDEESFVRRCADFHFDFLRVHPFSDANGRTSRMLLSTLFASRNMLFPSLYVDAVGKCDFYLGSNAALYGNYKPTEYDLIYRLGHFYPMILPEKTDRSTGRSTGNER